MAVKEKEQASYADLVAAPGDQIAELAGGDLYLSPRPRPRHARIASALGSDLHDAFDHGRSGPGGWWVIFEPELHLDGNVLVPDLAAWRRDRMPSLPDEGWFEAAPDWVCEILSPSTEELDRTRKMPRYAYAGIPTLWIVDPPARRLEIYSRNQTTWHLDATLTDVASVSAPPFEAITIDLGRLWS